jgi:hypothetical protein
VKTVFCEKCAKKCLTPKLGRARMASLIDETATVRPASVSNQAKALDKKSELCETGLTDSSSTGSTARAAKSS